MNNPVLKLLLVGVGLLAGGVARAQYAAPGFPMLPLHRMLPAASPSPAPLASPVLPRFWHEPDSARQAAGRTRFFEFVIAQAQYPAGARPPQNQPNALLPTGRLFLVVQVRPDGSVRRPPRIRRRELERPAADYSPASLQALDGEAQRVLGALRFVRSRAVLDSLVVPIRFVAQ